MRMMLLAVASFLTFSTIAHAEETRFICGSEEATNAIAEKLVIGQKDADEAAAPFLDQSVCMYLPEDIHIDITYRGKIFGQNDFYVQVVGFMDSEHNRMMYGLMQREINAI